jgi:hypothetical protein
MGVLESLKRVKISQIQDEKPGIITPENGENRKPSQDEKLDQILAELKSISAVLVQHDQHLTAVDNNILSHVTEMMERKKEIPEGKRLEAENIIRKSKSRAEAIEKLKAIGISQATAYRYTEDFKGK